jgi:hypothetical protein
VFPSKDQFSDFGSPRFADLINSIITNHFLLKSTVPNKNYKVTHLFSTCSEKSSSLDHGGHGF